MFSKSALTLLAIGALSVSAMSVPVARAPAPESEREFLPISLLHISSRSDLRPKVLIAREGLEARTHRLPHIPAIGRELGDAHSAAKREGLEARTYRLPNIPAIGRELGDAHSAAKREGLEARTHRLPNIPAIGRELGDAHSAAKREEIQHLAARGIIKTIKGVLGFRDLSDRDIHDLVARTLKPNYVLPIMGREPQMTVHDRLAVRGIGKTLKNIFLRDLSDREIHDLLVRDNE